MAWSTTDLPDLSGSVAVVTGANGGLGFETALALAGTGAHIVMAARDREKVAAASESILAVHPDATTELQDLDLASIDSVRNAAAAISERHDSIEILVNNAGVMAIPERRTMDGFEMQFGTNHLGHFALTGFLWPVLVAGDGARVIAITSFARHFRGRFDPDDPPLVGEYDAWKAYGQSKMANLRFALELDRRVRRAGLPIRSLAVHPGLSHTDLQSNRARATGETPDRRFPAALWPRLGMPAAAGALSQIRAAADLKVKGGQFYSPRFIASGASVRRPLMPWTRHNGQLRRLWEVSERLTGTRFEV